MANTTPRTNDSRHCVHCLWVQVAWLGARRSLSCACPKCLRGQASEYRTCCSYEREPGSDDELERDLAIGAAERAVVFGGTIGGKAYRAGASTDWGRAAPRW